MTTMQKQQDLHENKRFQRKRKPFAPLVVAAAAVVLLFAMVGAPAADVPGGIARQLKRLGAKLPFVGSSDGEAGTLEPVTAAADERIQRGVLDLFDEFEANDDDWRPVPMSGLLNGMTDTNLDAHDNDVVLDAPPGSRE